MWKLTIHKYLYIFVALLLCLLSPVPAYASGMEGLAILIVLFIAFVSTIPGAIIKRIIPIPENKREDFGNIIFLVMLAEAIILLISSLLGSALVAGFESSHYRPTFLYPAIPIQISLAIFPNLFLLKQGKETFAKLFLKVENIINAAVFSIFAPVVFAALISIVAY